MSATASAGSAIPLTDSAGLLPPSLEILLSPEATDVDENNIQYRQGKLFETDPTHCWIDLFSPGCRSDGNNKSTPWTGEEDTDIEYVRIAFMMNAELRIPHSFLGRCSIPFQRARNAQQCKDLVERVKLDTSEDAKSSPLQPVVF